MTNTTHKPDPNSPNAFDRFEHAVRIAACEIEVLGKRGFVAHVWVEYATTLGGDASLIVKSSDEFPGFRTGRWVKPNDCGASGWRSWGSVPFDQTLHFLRQATADVPVIARKTGEAA